MPTTPPTIPSAEDRAARQMAMLRELAEIGMELARALGAQALGELSPADETAAKAVTGADPVEMFTRVARAVRQTVALEMRISRADAEDQAEDDRALHRYERIARRTLVHEMAAEAVEAQAEGGRRERLLEDLDLRMERAERERLYEADLPVPVLVARLCRDLGVRPTLWAEDPEDDEAGEPMPGEILARMSGRRPDFEPPPRRR